MQTFEFHPFLVKNALSQWATSVELRFYHHEQIKQVKVLAFATRTVPSNTELLCNSARAHFSRRV